MCGLWYSKCNGSSFADERSKLEKKQKKTSVDCVVMMKQKASWRGIRYLQVQNTCIQYNKILALSVCQLSVNNFYFETNRIFYIWNILILKYLHGLQS